MKLWVGYGTEHSMNLVMIGKFDENEEASQAFAAIQHIIDQASADVESGLLEVGDPPDRYTDAMMKLAQDLKFYSLHPGEFEQFVYEVAVDLKDDKIVITTDEADVSAFLKFLVDKGARVEVFSAHHHDDTGYGRGSER